MRARDGAHALEIADGALRTSATSVVFRELRRSAALADRSLTRRFNTARCVRAPLSSILENVCRVRAPCDPTAVSSHPATPDGRYFVVRGRLWRCSNPRLSVPDRQALVKALMKARRDVKAALAQGDEKELGAARARVDAVKRDLGERGPVWWEDGAPDLNRHFASHTLYADLFADLGAAD